jgi:predicted MFS family arabinose efflux permease
MVPTDSPAKERHPAPVSLAFTVWGLAAALYVVGFFHRVAPAVITAELAAEFDLTAAALGNLSALYFYSYVAMQVPTGVLVDRYGPRSILAIAALGAAGGALLFAAADTFAVAGAGRLLIGASVGVAFVAMMKLSTHWFPPSRFALVAGLALATGMVGAISAGAPLRWLTDSFGWRAVILGAGAATAALAAAIWLVVRDDPEERGYASYLPARRHDAPAGSMLGGLGQVLRSRNVLLICAMNGGVSTAPLTFAGLWGVPFLATQYGLSTAGAAGVCSLTLLAWGVGGPLIGALSDRRKERKRIYLAGAVVAAAAWSVALLVPRLPIWLIVALLVVAAMASGVIMVGYAFAKESAPAALAGTTGGVVNMGNMIGGMVMQPAVGWVLDRAGPTGLEEEMRVYPFEAYQAGFLLMLTLLYAAVVLTAFTREARGGADSRFPIR